MNLAVPVAAVPEALIVAEPDVLGVTLGCEPSVSVYAPAGKADSRVKAVKQGRRVVGREQSKVSMENLSRRVEAVRMPRIITVRIIHAKEVGDDSY